MVQPTVVAVTPLPAIDTRSVMGLSAVRRCVLLIADTVADMPWQEWKGDELLPASRLVRRPYALMTRREWTWRVVATEALWSTVYLLHVGGTDAQGRPWSLLPLPPSLVTPGPTDPWGLTPPSEYYVAGQRVSAANLTVIRRTPLPGVSDELAGLIQLARAQFTSYVGADIHAARYWANGGPTTTVITTDQEISDTDAEGIAQRWVDRRAMGSDRPAVLGKGAEAKPWGADPTAESATEARREINAEIGRHFGVPTRILNAPAGDSETYSNVEMDAIDLYRYSLRGYMGPIEDGISDLLPGDPIEGRRMLMDPARFLQGDLSSRATAWSTIVTAGIADPDEARVRGFGLPPRQSAAVASGQDPIEEPTTVTVTAGAGQAPTTV